jgi:hypothetical protein
MPTTCPSCGATFEDDHPVCPKCLFVIDRERWNEDAGSPGADADDRARELADAPIGPRRRAERRPGLERLPADVQQLPARRPPSLTRAG